jgi:putative SOS response-associated peptidase YedK
VHYSGRGYYEWRTINGEKQPYYFSASDAGVLSIAGLWDEWNDITSGEPLLSCTMIVTEAKEFAGRIHDRMPVFLAGDSFEAWLDGSAGVETQNLATTTGPVHYIGRIISHAILGELHHQYSRI